MHLHMPAGGCLCVTYTLVVQTKEVMELFVEDVWKAGLHVPEPYVGPQAAAAAVVPDTAPSTPSKSVASGGTKSANSSGGGGGGSSHHRRSGSSGSHHRRTASGHGLGDIATEAQATSAETTTVSSVGSTTAAVSIATRTPSVSDVLATAAAGPCVASVSSSEDRALYALRRRDSAGIDSGEYVHGCTVCDQGDSGQDGCTWLYCV